VSIFAARKISIFLIDSGPCQWYLGETMAWIWTDPIVTRPEEFHRLGGVRDVSRFSQFHHEFKKQELLLVIRA
jgi:hypothetical protein